MKKYLYKTNLRCQSCLDKITPLLNNNQQIKNWSVDLNSSNKTLKIETTLNISELNEIFNKEKYQISLLDEKKSYLQLLTTYRPLLLVVGYIVLVSTLLSQRGFSFQHSFMAGFFLAFSFFKMLDLTSFANSYTGYDLVASRWRTYAFIYPFLELGFGVFYLITPNNIYLNLAVSVVMSVSLIGVVQAVWLKKKIQCACLGTVFKLPMSSVTIIEDLIMLLMAISQVFDSFGLG